MEAKQFGTSPENLSYSIFLDKIKRDPVINNNSLEPVRQKQPLSWVPDDAVTACYICKKEFTFWRRIHHCRICKRAFCGSCSNNFIVIPKNMETMEEEEEKRWSYNTLTTNLKFRFIQTPRKEKEKRVCDTCNKRVQSIKNVELYILIFSYCDIKTLFRLGTVCKEWYKAANICKSIFRDIQYLLPSYEMSPIQKRLLWNSRDYLAGHSKWLVKLIVLVDNEMRDKIIEIDGIRINEVSVPDESISELERILTSKKKIECWNLMCTRLCNCQITGYEWLELIDLRLLKFSKIANQLFIDAMNNLSSTEFDCLILQLVFSLRYYTNNNCPLFDLLISKSENYVLRNSIYWALVMLKTREPLYVKFYSLYMLKLDQIYGKNVVYDELIKGRSLFKSLSNVTFIKNNVAKNNISLSFLHSLQSYNNDITIRFSPHEPLIRPENRLILPLNPNYQIVTLEAYDIETKDSITLPTLMPLLCCSRDTVNETSSSATPTYSSIVRENTLNKREDLIVKPIIYKKECLIKDQVILNIIRMMDIILKRDEGIDFGIKTYRVLPINNNSGFIEVIPNSETLYNLKHKLNFTIQNYLIERNPSLLNEEWRHRFVKSAAAYCVISYLLGIGDRHLDNIMITEDGYLFHIDYGFILGNDPRPLKPSMRITQDIVDTMGGESSSHFSLFKKYCTQIYNCLRKYTWLFMSMLLLITEDGLSVDNNKYTKAKLREEIISRFIPSEDHTEASSQLLIKVDDSYRSYTPHILIDLWHYNAKEYLSRLSSFSSFPSLSSFSSSLPSLSSFSITHSK